MLSRERMITTLAHKIPDRVPIDLGGVVSGIHIHAYKRLLNLLGINDNQIHFYDYNQQIVTPCEALLERLHIDTRYLHPPASLVPEHFSPVQEGPWIGNWDNFGIFWGNYASTETSKRLYYSPVIHPLADLKTVQEIHAFDWPKGSASAQFLGLKEYAEKVYKSGYAVVSRVIGCIYEYTTFLFGLKTAMRYLRTNPELIKAAMEDLLEYWTDFATAYLKQVGNNVDVVCINGDVADQNGPMMNPAIYAKIAVPIEAEFVRRIRKITTVPINYHSCGSVVAFIPYFDQIGFNAINPVQISAVDMQPASLKRRFGDKICFWGGACDTQKTMPFGTPSQVKAEVKQNLTDFKPGGGYIASNIHNITAEVPAENILAMFDALYEFGGY